MSDQSTEHINQPTEISEETNQALSLVNIENLIKTFIVDSEKLQEKMKTQKEMLESTLLNDATYAEHDKKVKDATKERTAVKKKLMNDPAVELMVETIEDLKNELKGMRGGLSEYLEQYFKLANTNQIMMDDGKIMQIITVSKLVRMQA